MKMEKSPQFTFTNEEYYDPALMVSYAFSTDDKESFIAFDIDGKEYLLMDSYCKNPNCNCSGVFLDFVDRANLKESVATFHYDYERGVVTEEITPVPQFFIDKLENDKELNGILAQRNILIRRGFADYSIKRESLKMQHNIQNKLGRNDPCSCGSGKKYKKCCGF
jgi:SEC-C motif domain protein